MPRKVPCLGCRAARIKCTWPESGLVCNRCLRGRNLTCSGPTRKTMLPCLACVKGKTKCVWMLSSASCQKCHDRGRPCTGPSGLNLLPRRGTSIYSSESSSSSEETRICAVSRHLAYTTTVNLVDDQLVLAGREYLSILNFTCLGDALKFELPAPELQEVARLMYIFNGVKFSTHPSIIGRENAKAIPHTLSLIPTTARPTSLPYCGAYRETGLSTLTSRIWVSIKTLPRLSSPADICVFIAILRLAAKMGLPEEDEERETIRRAYAWGASATTAVVDGDEATREQKAYLEGSWVQMGTHEAIYSLVLGRPSLISTKVFHRICNIPRNPIVLVPHPPSTFSPIFVPTALRVPGDLARLTWAVLAPPPTALTLSLLRRMSLSPLFSFHADSPEYWRTQDELFSHVDHIYATILEDERYDDRTKDRAWTILRAVSTFEQFVVQAVFLGHGVVERASITTNLAEMFYILELFTSNVMLLGASLGDHIRRLPPEERQWFRITHCLSLASFWDPSASRAVFELDSLFESLSLDKTPASPPVPPPAPTLVPPLVPPLTPRLASRMASRLVEDTLSELLAED